MYSAFKVADARVGKLELLQLYDAHQSMGEILLCEVVACSGVLAGHAGTDTG